MIRKSILLALVFTPSIYADTVIDTIPGNCSNLQVGEYVWGGTYLGQTFTAPEPVLDSFSFVGYSSRALSADDFEFRVLVTEANVQGPFDVRPSTNILFESETIVIPLGATGNINSQLVEVDFGEVGETYVLLLDGISTIDGLPGVGGILNTRCDNPYPGGHVIWGPVRNFSMATPREITFSGSWQPPMIGIDFAMVMSFSSGSAKTVGDITGDGKVDFADFLILSASFGQAGGLSDGDLDSDGLVGFSDFLILSNNFGGTAVSVPEPSSLGLIGLGVVALFRSRRSR